MSLHEDMTAAERDFFGSRGRNTDALLAENRDGVQRVTDEIPVQSVPDAGADGDKPLESGGPSESQAAAHPPSPAAVQDETKSAPVPLEEPSDEELVRTKRVTWNKYQREMDARKELERQIEELRKEQLEATRREATTNERLRLFNEALQPDQPQQVDEDPAPDPMQDAYGYMQWQTRQMERMRAEQEQYRQQQNTHTVEQQVVQAYRDDAQRFSAQNPLFPQMYSYLISHRDMQLQIAQPDMTPQQRAEAIKAEEFDLAQRFLAAGRSPSQGVYQMARAYGFDGWYAQQQNQSATPGAGGGAVANGVNGTSPPLTQAAPAPSNPGVPTAVQQVQAIAANQNASRSLSNGGGAPLQNIDARSLANMTQEEFEAVFNRLQNSRNKAQLRELMGY